MRQMQPVLWTKGAFLSPQHLQTQDRFLEDLIEFQLSALTFCPWGFSRLQIDREAVAAGSFALTAASGIFADGLQFDFPESDAAPPPIQLEESWEQDQETLDVFLTVPEFRYGGSNVSAQNAETSTRYRAEVIQQRDENTGLAEKPIQVASKNLRFLAEGESLEGRSALRVARIARSTTGEYDLSPHFVPPLLNLSANSYVLSVARRLVEVLTAKSSTLSGMRRQRNQGLADFGVADVANFWLLYTVNSHMPQMRHLFETRHGHPGELYQAMLSLAGALTTFSSTVHPRDLPTYDHNDLAPCLTELDEKLRELLETVIPSQHASLPMRLVEPSVYATALDQERFLRAPAAFLAIHAGLKEDQLIRGVATLVKVSAADHISRLIKQALPGVSLKHVSAPPRAIPIKLNYQYFQLDLSGPDWDAIKRARNLAAYVPSDFPNPEIELVVILPPE